MCAPVIAALPAVMATLSAATSVLAIRQQQNTADAQADAIRQSTIDNYAALDRKAVELRENQAQQQDQINRQTTKNLGTARTQIAADGVGGASVAALLGDLAGQGAAADANSDLNYLRQSQSLQDQKKQLTNQGASQMSQVQTPTWGDYGRAGLSIANAADKWSNRNTVKGME